MLLKVTTYNIQHSRDFVSRNIDISGIANIIKGFNSDIIGLNEVFGYGSSDYYHDQVKEIASILGYNYYFGKAIEVKKQNGVFGNYGNALLSKYEIVDPETIKIPDPLVRNEDVYYESRIIIKAKVQGITIFVTHVGLAKDEQYNAISTLLDNLNNTPFIIMGDFNMTSDNNNIQRLSNITYDTGNNITGNNLSFPVNDKKIKIDYIFTSKDIETLDATIPEIVKSDHFPLNVTLKTKKDI